ncbi:MAG: hypothetical protein LBQ54_06145 [Planctomycetaceae bacterium]|jgi:hypothetical protein|nr:hypothetical protein [Planctomycetaceae bacterium]
MKSILITCSFVLCAFVFADTARAGDGFFRNSHAYYNSGCGQVVFGDKFVQSHDALMNPYGGGAFLGGLFLPRGRYVDGYGRGTYGAGNSINGYPYYIYRGPRDFLNPNPPSIGY